MKHPERHSDAPGVSSGRRRFLTASMAAIAATAVGRQVGAQTGEGSLHLYSWRDYTGKSVLADFIASTGISVTARFYDNSDEMFRTVFRGEPQFDVLIASYDYLEHLIADQLLQPLDHSKIPNISNLFPAFRDARFDPGHRYSLPYLWGTQGICFRRSAVRSTPNSWEALLDSNAHSGRIALPGIDTIGLALKYLGYSYNSVNPDELEAAGELLIRQKPHVISFHPTNGIELLANGEVDLAVGWNTEVFDPMQEDDDIDYRVPAEGGLLWQDRMCIPHTATNPAGAHTLINYALDAETGAAIARNFWYATPNRAALALLPDTYREDPTVFPGMEIIRRCEPALSLGREGTRLREQVWNKVIES